MLCSRYCRLASPMQMEFATTRPASSPVRGAPRALIVAAHLFATCRGTAPSRRLQACKTASLACVARSPAPHPPLTLPPQAEYCAKGSLTELLAEGREDAAAAAELTWRRRLSMVRCSSASAEQATEHCCGSTRFEPVALGSRHRRQSLLTRPDLSPSAHPPHRCRH